MSTETQNTDSFRILGDTDEVLQEPVQESQSAGKRERDIKERRTEGSEETAHDNGNLSLLSSSSSAASEDDSEYELPVKRKKVRIISESEHSDENESNNYQNQNVHELSEDQVSVSSKSSENFQDSQNPISFENEKAIVEAEVQPAKPTKTRNRLPKNRNLSNKWTKKNPNQMIEIIRNHPRPVIFRVKPLTATQMRQKASKRTRVTRAILKNMIPQYHLLNGNTEVIQKKSLPETIESYLDHSKMYTQYSGSFYDEFIITAVEYDRSIKMFNFGASMKKHSCKQKITKFQTAWWHRNKSPLAKPSRSGWFQKPVCPVLDIKSDPLLYGKHFMFPPVQKSELEKVLDQMIYRLTRNRQDDNIILDSSYFVREFFLKKSLISFRISRSSDVPLCFVPPTLTCGYFPHSAVTNDDKKQYLMDRYVEAQLEYLNLNYRSIKPPDNFTIGSITKEELWSFHCIGRHIHGFFVVWEPFPKKKICDSGENTVKDQRYLVDTFNRILFPLYIDYNRWETRLKLAFDQVIIYNLHLSEVIRVNRPVFDALAQNDSLFQELTLKEITYMMKEKEIRPAQYCNTLDVAEFYDWGNANTNDEFLSAFMIICGGTKIAHSSDAYDLEHMRVYNRIQDRFGVLTKEGKVYTNNTEISPQNVFVNNEKFSNRKKLIHVRPLHVGSNLDKEQKTRLISNGVKKLETFNGLLRRRKLQWNYSLLTRKQLINARRVMYNIPKQPAPQTEKKSAKKEKKKPGRKIETMVDKALKKYDFDPKVIPFDFESDYEDCLSEEEDFVSDERPLLKRSISTESIFLDVPYQEKLLNKVSQFHSHTIHKIPQKIAKRKRRKMNEIMQKHRLRYELVETDDAVFHETMQCYHGELPFLAAEIAKTKKACRNPYLFARHKIPKIYERGEANMIDEVSGLLKYMVTLTVGVECASARNGNLLSRAIQEARVERKIKTDEFPLWQPNEHENFKYIVMELFTGTRIQSEYSADDHIDLLKKDVESTSKTYKNVPVERIELRMKNYVEHRDQMVYERVLAKMEKWERHRMSFTVLPIEIRSKKYYERREEKRKLDRRIHAQKERARKVESRNNAYKLDSRVRVNKRGSETLELRIKENIDPLPIQNEPKTIKTVNLKVKENEASKVVQNVPRTNENMKTVTQKKTKEYETPQSVQIAPEARKSGKEKLKIHGSLKVKDNEDSHPAYHGSDVRESGIESGNMETRRQYETKQVETPEPTRIASEVRKSKKRKHDDPQSLQNSLETRVNREVPHQLKMQRPEEYQPTRETTKMRADGMNSGNMDYEPQLQRMEQRASHNGPSAKSNVTFDMSGLSSMGGSMKKRCGKIMDAQGNGEAYREEEEEEESFDDLLAKLA